MAIKGREQVTAQSTLVPLIKTGISAGINRGKDAAKRNSRFVRATTFDSGGMSGTFRPRRSLSISLTVARKMLHVTPFAQKVVGEYVILVDTF